MKENYETIIKNVLRSEGGYGNDPRDRGGPTNFGITIHDYRAYINPNGTAQDVKAMTVEQAKEIYKTKYWDTVHGDDLASGVDYTVFDYGVNSGVGRANKVYDHYKSITDPNQLIDAICNERMRFLKGLPIWKFYGKGWTARVTWVRQFSHILAQHELAKPIVVTPIIPKPKQQVTLPWYTSLIVSFKLLLNRFWKTS